MKRAARGFSLIELMVVLFVVGILAAVAIDQYSSYMVRATRSAAQAYLLTIASKQEEFVVRNHFYAMSAVKLPTNDDPDERGLGLTEPTDVTTYYTISIEPLTNGFVAIATAKPGTRQTPDGDLKVNHRGVKTPPDKWGGR